MKIAIISDVHANIYGLKKVLSDLPKVDKIICAGDITGFYPFVNEVIDELKRNDVVIVKGNHDQYLVQGFAPENANKLVKESVAITKTIISEENLKFLEQLPEKLKITIDGKKALVCHGSPWNYLEERIYPDFPNFEKFKNIKQDVVILGHTHYPFIKKIENLTIVNPGSCGQPRDYNLASYVLWNTENNSFENKRVSFDIDEFKREALKRGTDKKLFEVFKRIKK